MHSTCLEFALKVDKLYSDIDLGEPDHCTFKMIERFWDKYGICASNE